MTFSEKPARRDSNPLEFEGFRSRAGLNSFGMVPRQWIETTSAVGLISKSGRDGGGTYAHRDIAFEFGSWLRGIKGEGERSVFLTAHEFSWAS